MNPKLDQPLINLLHRNAEYRTILIFVTIRTDSEESFLSIVDKINDIQYAKIHYEWDLLNTLGAWIPLSEIETLAESNAIQEIELVQSTTAMIVDLEEQISMKVLNIPWIENLKVGDVVCIVFKYDPDYPDRIINHYKGEVVKCLKHEIRVKYNENSVLDFKKNSGNDTIYYNISKIVPYTDEIELQIEKEQLLVYLEDKHNDFEDQSLSTLQQLKTAIDAILST